MNHNNAYFAARSTLNAQRRAARNDEANYECNYMHFHTHDGAQAYIDGWQLDAYAEVVEVLNEELEPVEVFAVFSTLGAKSTHGFLKQNGQV